MMRFHIERFSLLDFSWMKVQAAFRIALIPKAASSSLVFGNQSTHFLWRRVTFAASSVGVGALAS